MENVAASITAQQRVGMIMKGLNPRDPKEVQKYLAGESLSASEKAERAKKLFEGTNNLGGAHEQDIDVESKIGKEFSPSSLQQPAPVTDYRQQLQEDLQGYGSNAGKVFTSDDFISLKRPQQIQQVQQQHSSISEIKKEGFEKSKAYVNAFILNLQSPSFNSRISLFKLLQECLKGEQKYKANGNALQAYRQGVQEAETIMLQKLQS